MAIAVAIALSTMACWSMVRLPAMHPAQLWTIPWALATGLFAARLLPYRSLDAGTALLIVGGAAAFVSGSVVAGRVLTRHLGASGGLAGSSRPPDPHSLAAGLALAALVATLAAFIAQIIHAFGVRAALISSPEVRLAIGGGATPVTIKYVYFAFAAVALCVLAGAREQERNASRRWILAAVLAGCSMYFATGRANVVLALLIGLLTWAVARPTSITKSSIALTLGSVLILGLLVFSIGGAIIGKTFSANEVSTINSVFTRHKDLSVLAVPYEYAATPIAGLQREVELSSTWGQGHGCATLAFVCQILRRAGIHVEPEPAIRAATKAPLRWNTYTGLDYWLIDGGLALMIPIALAFGAMMGALWAVARTMHAGAVVLYAIFSSTLLFSAYQNSFFAPHIVGSAVIGMSALIAERWIRSRREKALGAKVVDAIRA